MKHVHKATGIEFEVGYLIDTDNKTFDITVIMFMRGIKAQLVNFYYGGYDEAATNTYIDAWINENATLVHAFKVVDTYYTVNNEVLGADENHELEITMNNLQNMISQRDILEVDAGLTEEERLIADKAKRLHALCEKWSNL